MCKRQGGTLPYALLILLQSVLYGFGNPLSKIGFESITVLWCLGIRFSGAAALMGSMLKLHPKIVVRDGQMLVDKKYRGSLARCIPAYTHDLHDDLLRARPERVFITHSGCDPEVVEQVRTYLTSLNYFDAVIETRAGGVISCHCGPGTLGVLFILKE